MSIQGYFVVLMQNLDVEAILPYLKQARMVTYTEYEQVSSPHLPLKQKRDKLLLLLTKKGPNHYTYFCWCIVWSGQRALAEKMLVDLSSVPRSIDDVFPATVGSYAPFPLTSAKPAAGAGLPIVPNPPLPPQRASQHNASATLAEPSLSTKKRTRPLNVLLLYCKDAKLACCEQLDPAHRRSPEDYCKEMLCLADTLTMFSAVEGEDGQSVPGFRCTYDGYDDQKLPENWLRWTEDRLREADCVLLACSPTLASSLLSSPTIEMERALCAVNSLINTMPDPDKPFYPIFLNMPRQADWIPTQLKNHSCFRLNISAFHNALGNIDGLDEESFFRRAYQCFESDSQKRFADLLSLLKMLRGEFTKPPEPTSIAPTLPSHQNKQRISAGKIDDSILQEIACNMALRWQELAVQLEIPFLETERIKSQYPHDLRSRVMAILHEWQDKKKELATRSSLKQAMINLGYRGLANRLFPND